MGLVIPPLSVAIKPKGGTQDVFFYFIDRPVHKGPEERRERELQEYWAFHHKQEYHRNHSCRYAQALAA